MPADHTTPPSSRTRLRRYHWLARYDREAIDAIIDAGIVCQVGYVVDGRPYVTPTSHWRIDDHVYWHGSSASRMLKAQGAGAPVCFSVTHLDGLVFARASFNHNVNYRSVMAFGEAELVGEEEKRHALAIFTDRIAPGLWAHARPPTEQEWKATRIIRLKLDEVAAKMRSGPPVDDPEDMGSDLWAGVLPLGIVAGEALSDPALPSGEPMPAFLKEAFYATPVGPLGHTAGVWGKA